jgi:hypothetical protein
MGLRASGLGFRVQGSGADRAGPVGRHLLEHHAWFGVQSLGLGFRLKINYIQTVFLVS